MRMKSLLLILIGLLIACTAVNPPLEETRQPENGEAVDTNLLDGTEWELVELNGRFPIPNSRTTLSFNDGNAGGFAGCNDYGASYTVEDDDALAFGEGAKNEQGCIEPEGILGQEEEFVAMLIQMTTFTMQGEQLLLTSADGKMSLLFQPILQFTMNPSDLIGTEWQLVSWSDRELFPNSGITLRFDDAETISGFAGCRNFEGSYTAENDSFNNYSMSMQEITCDAPEEVLIQEGDYTTALSETSKYLIEDEQLTLFTNPGAQLVFIPLLPAEEATPENEAILITPTPVVEPTPEPELPITFGDSKRLGRGQIIDAEFTADGAGLAVAWGNGASFSTVSDTITEQWFQPLPADSIALDLSSDGQWLAVGMSNEENPIYDLKN